MATMILRVGVQFVVLSWQHRHIPPKAFHDCLLIFELSPAFRAFPKHFHVRRMKVSKSFNQVWQVHTKITILWFDIFECTRRSGSGGYARKLHNDGGFFWLDGFWPSSMKIISIAGFRLSTRPYLKGFLPLERCHAVSGCFAFMSSDRREFRFAAPMV